MVATFYQPTGNTFFRRSYIAGIAFGWGADSLTVSGNVIEFYSTPILFWHLVVKPAFWYWSSNSYSLDWLFDPVLTKHYVNGIEVTYGGMYVYRQFYLNESDWWIKLTGYGYDLGRTDFVQLPAAPSNYWRQPSPAPP